VKLILDTGPLAALMNRRDRWHDWAIDALRAAEPPLLTCEAVLTEASYLTRRPAEIMSRVESGALRIGLDAEKEATALVALLSKYAPRMDLADACVVRLSEIFPRARVLTVDRRDFGVYRRNGREVIPLLAPP
jgi:predicted nucleic acid-binding protein